MPEYINRLRVCGIKESDAAILVNDFLRDGDYDGLCAFVLEVESLHRELMSYVD